MNGQLFVKLFHIKWEKKALSDIQTDELKKDYLET